MKMTSRVLRALSLSLLQIIALLLPVQAAEVVVPTQIKEPQHTDSLVASIVTAAPGREVYQLEGHAALRLRKFTTDSVTAQPRQVYDVAVNWGVFDFASPNFLYRFVKGETDYMAAAYPFEIFLREYIAENRRVVEQQLNLTAEEALRLEALVTENLRPENCIYRYNYVKDNCATRPLALVEAAIGSKIILNDTVAADADRLTFRREMTRYHAHYPWYQFGIDLALGSGIDYNVTARERTFAPIYLQRQLNTATRLKADGRLTPMVTATHVLVDGAEDGVQSGATPALLTPMAASIALLLLTIALSVRDVRRKRLTRLFDTLFYAGCFVCGCVLTFLIFVSVHEATSPNWLYLWLNPLCLIPAVCVWIKKCKCVVYWYQICNFAMLMLLLAGHHFLGQALNAAFPILILCDLIRSATQIYVCRCAKIG
jgi:hypothetical protein